MPPSTFGRRGKRRSAGGRSKSTFNRILRDRSQEMVRCPACWERLTLTDYVNGHAMTRHEWNPTLVCVYCSGGESWPPRERNFQHMVPCLRRFMDENAVRRLEEERMEEEEETAPAPCEECKNFRSKPRDMCGRKKDRLSEYADFYESVLEKPEKYSDSAIEFTEESGLGRDIDGIVRRFLKGDLEWYHLMVVHQNFDNFVKAMEEMKDQMFLLPYWCLCDGLTENRRTHRHMIIAFEPEAPFKYLWTTKVKYEFEDGGRSKYSIKIKDAFHLIRTIQYVSQRKASCDGTRINDEVGETVSYSHFHYNHHLHEHSIVHMSTLVEGGMESLLKEQHRNKDVVGWLNSVEKISDEHRNAKYAVPIAKTGFKFLECVLPLASHYEPTEEETDRYVTWFKNKKMYLRINLSLKNMSREDWYAHQVAKGNTVWSIRHEWYVLSPRQQNMMNQIKVALKEASEMEKNRSEKKSRNWEAKYADLESKYATLEVKYATLEVKYATSEAERIRVTVENEQMKKEFESQILQNLNISIVWEPNELRFKVSKEKNDK